MDMTNEMEHGQRTETADSKQPFDDLLAYLADYTRERPGVVALWCLGIGFVLGWKLKPW